MGCKKRLRGMEKGLKHQNVHPQTDPCAKILPVHPLILWSWDECPSSMFDPLSILCPHASHPQGWWGCTSAYRHPVPKASRLLALVPSPEPVQGLPSPQLSLDKGPQWCPFPIFGSAVLTLTHPHSLGWGNKCKGLDSFRQKELNLPPVFCCFSSFQETDTHTHNYC